MRILVLFPALTLLACTLAGCNTGAPQGVLPRTAVPPPPSLGGNTPKAAAAQKTGAVSQRRALDVPDRLEAPRPSSSPAVQPVMTPGGVGAGFRF